MARIDALTACQFEHKLQLVARVYLLIQHDAKTIPIIVTTAHTSRYHTAAYPLPLHLAYVAAAITADYIAVVALLTALDEAVPAHFLKTSGRGS